MNKKPSFIKEEYRPFTSAVFCVIISIIQFITAENEGEIIAGCIFAFCAFVWIFLAVVDYHQTCIKILESNQERLVKRIENLEKQNKGE